MNLTHYVRVISKIAPEYTCTVRWWKTLGKMAFCLDCLHLTFCVNSCDKVQASRILYLKHFCLWEYDPKISHFWAPGIIRWYEGASLVWSDALVIILHSDYQSCIVFVPTWLVILCLCCHLTSASLHGIQRIWDVDTFHAKVPIERSFQLSSFWLYPYKCPRSLPWNAVRQYCRVSEGWGLQ